MKDYVFESDSTIREKVVEQYFNRLKYPVTYHFTEGRFTPFDCIYHIADPIKKDTLEDKDVILEIKNRNCSSDKYSSTYISKFKYEHLTGASVELCQALFSERYPLRPSRVISEGIAPLS